MKTGPPPPPPHLALKPSRPLPHQLDKVFWLQILH
jgi:hypothetical protein